MSWGEQEWQNSRWWAVSWGEEEWQNGRSRWGVWPGGWWQWQGRSWSEGMQPSLAEQEPTSNSDGESSVEGYDRKMKAAVHEFIAEGAHSIYILAVKGNYAHRLLKLGIEITDPMHRTEFQQRLADILRTSGLLHGDEEQVGRPEWAKGACLYLTPEAVQAFEWKDQAQRDKVLGLTLQSKHVVCSREFLGLVIDALNDHGEYADKVGREAYLVRRTKDISDRVLVHLPAASI